MFGDSSSSMPGFGFQFLRQGVGDLNHHFLSFQSSSHVAANGDHATSMLLPPAGFFVSPNSSLSPSLDAFHSPSPKYKFVTCSPSDWTASELSILKEGLSRCQYCSSSTSSSFFLLHNSHCSLSSFRTISNSLALLYSSLFNYNVRYAHDPNIMKYIKIAAMLPTRTIRDVALRCWWTTGKESRRKPDEFHAGKKIRDMKDKIVDTTSPANFHMAPSNSVIPFSISIHHPSQYCPVPKEVPVLDSATQHLLEENNQLLNQIAANIELCKLDDNTDLFVCTNNNIKTILRRMSDTPGIMGQMPPLPVPVNEDHLNSLLQLDRMVASYGVPVSCHMKLEPGS